MLSFCFAVVAAVSHVQPIIIADDEDKAQQHTTSAAAADVVAGDDHGTHQQHTTSAATEIAGAPQLPDEALLPAVAHDSDRTSDMLSPPAFPAFPEQITGGDAAIVDSSTAPSAQPAATAGKAEPVARTPQLPKARHSKLFTPSQERKFTREFFTFCILNIHIQTWS